MLKQWNKAIREAQFVSDMFIIAASYLAAYLITSSSDFDIKQLKPISDYLLPLYISVPGDGSGQCGALAQPQDLFTTLAPLCGVEAPPGLDGQDLLAVARGDAPGSRSIALAGPSADAWVQRFARDPAAILFTVFDADRMLQVAMAPEHSRLARLGDLTGALLDDGQAVSELHDRALDEVERRGAPAPLVAWLRSRGARPAPEDCPLWSGWPGPAGYTQYWNRVHEVG